MAVDSNSPPAPRNLDYSLGPGTMPATKRLRSTAPAAVTKGVRLVPTTPRTRTNRRAPGASLTSVGVPIGKGAKSQPHEGFDVQALLRAAGLEGRVVKYGRAAVIFRQGDPCDSVMYIQSGLVKISVVSNTGRQAVVAMLGPGDFCGVGGLAGQPVRMESASAAAGTTVLVVDQIDMVRLLHEQHAMADVLIAHLLTRTIQIEEDLIDQLFSSSERRLARKLLILARYSEPDKSVRAVPAISQETLAEMVGTTRSRVNFFMKKFQRLGLIDYDNGLRVHDSLLTVVLHD
jgi:CRP/FNR family cyclic AMP-dependent transcriptional regulator